MVAEAEAEAVHKVALAVEVVRTVEIDQIQMTEVTDRDQVHVMIAQELVEVQIVHEQVEVEIVHEQEVVDPPACSAHDALFKRTDVPGEGIEGSDEKKRGKAVSLENAAPDWDRFGSRLAPQRDDCPPPPHQPFNRAHHSPIYSVGTEDREDPLVAD